jgi:predicted nucleic-acid-binding protein
VIGIDTNVLVRILVRDDTDQADAALAVIEASIAAGHRIVVNAINLAELAWVLRSRFGYGKPQILEKLTQLLDQDDVLAVPERALHRAVAAWGEGRAGLADYLIVELNAEYDCTATLTFDREAAKHPACELIS